jgi:hypothetical protein
LCIVALGRGLTRAAWKWKKKGGTLQTYRFILYHVQFLFLNFLVWASMDV